MQTKNNPILAEIPPEPNLLTITLEPTSEQVTRLCTLMHNGCYVKVECGKTMQNLLCEQFQIPPEYITNEIKVIFLEYSPVDDLEAAIIKDGTTLALSAAMPGLVGAAMRRDGELTWMRNSITYHEGETEHREKQGLIQIKLFNKVMADLGESFLRRGVYVKAKYLSDFLERFTPDFWNEFGNITKNKAATTSQELISHLKNHDGWVKLSII